MWILIILTVLILIIHVRIRKSMNYWKDRNVPYIKPLPIFGNLALVIFWKRSFQQHVQYMYNAYPEKGEETIGDKYTLSSLNCVTSIISTSNILFKYYTHTTADEVSYKNNIPLTSKLPIAAEGAGKNFYDHNSPVKEIFYDYSDDASSDEYVSSHSKDSSESEDVKCKKYPAAEKSNSAQKYKEGNEQEELVKKTIGEMATVSLKRREMSFEKVKLNLFQLQEKLLKSRNEMKRTRREKERQYQYKKVKVYVTKGKLIPSKKIERFNYSFGQPKSDTCDAGMNNEEYKENYRYYGIFQFMTPHLLIRDPELIKQITVKDFDHFTDRTNVIRADVEPVLSKNLGGLKGQKWRDMRSTLSPSFTSSKMRFLFTLISDCAEQFTRYFEEQTSEEVIEVEMKDTFSRFTNDAIASAAFGVTVDSLKIKGNEFFLTGQKVAGFSSTRVLRFFGYSAFPWLMRLFNISLFPPAATDFFRRIITETIQVRKEKGVVRPDMIHILLQAGKEKAKDEDENHPDDGFAVVKELLPVANDKRHHKPKLDDDDITAQAMVFFFAGFETTSTLLSFLAYELALNPDIQQKLQHEIVEVKERSCEKISYEAVLGMKYLDMVVSEALRKWTPAFMLDRICIKDYVISPKFPEELEVTIEKGTNVFIPVVGFHFDGHYFPNPFKFDPERFNDENKKGIPPFTYMPFGSGPRNCIASRFALLETKVLLFHLLLKFDIVTTLKTSVPIVINKKSFSMIPDRGLWLGFKRKALQNVSK